MVKTNLQNKRKEERKAERAELQLVLVPVQAQELEASKNASSNELMNVFNLILSINTRIKCMIFQTHWRVRGAM